MTQPRDQASSQNVSNTGDSDFHDSFGSAVWYVLTSSSFATASSSDSSREPTGFSISPLLSLLPDGSLNQTTSVVKVQGGDGAEFLRIFGQKFFRGRACWKAAYITQVGACWQGSKACWKAAYISRVRSEE